MNTLALTGEKNLLMNAEEAAVGVEVAPLGAMTLEDGEYELADGRKIMIAGGTITEVIEKEAKAEEDEDKEEMVATVAEMLTASEAKIEAMIEAKLKPLAAAVSSHKPTRGAGPTGAGNASIQDSLQAKLEAKQAEIREINAKKRKA